MPKGKKKEVSNPDEGKETVNSEEVVQTERELQLKAQLDSIIEQLQNMKLEVEELRQGNDFLQQEAQQTRVETHEYLAYMSKKTQKRQSAVISLSDRNTEKIREIEKKKEELVNKYAKEKEELGKIIMKKEAELSDINKELEGLHDYRELQQEQQAEICQLEKKVSEMRIKHNEAVQKLKAKFLAEKNEFHSESEIKLKELNKVAKMEAHQYLQEHTVKIKQENRALRKELLCLIQKTRALHKHKLELEEQRKILLREEQYASNLQLIRKNRTKNIYQTYGVENKVDA